MTNEARVFAAAGLTVVKGDLDGRPRLNFEVGPAAIDLDASEVRALVRGLEKWLHDQKDASKARGVVWHGRTRIV